MPHAQPAKTVQASAQVSQKPPLAQMRSLSLANTPVVQRQTSCACGGGCPRCQSSSARDTNSYVSKPDDAYEREANQVAARVVNRRDQPTYAEHSVLQTKSAQAPRASRPTAFPIVNEVLASPGHPLEPTTRQFMESRFGHDFSQVRIHDDSYAQDAAQAIQARAFTLGQDIVFGTHQFAPESTQGRLLLAHELTHVVQQRYNPAGVIQRDPDDGPALTPEIVGREAGLLLCFILCELGVPPAIWRDLTELFLRAVWSEYRERYGQLRANARFQTFETAFRAYTPINVAKAILTFAVQGKIGPIPIRTAAARAAQESITRFLIARGATQSGIIAAEQIVRKVAFVIEIAIAAGCGSYCSARSYALLMRDMADYMAAGIVAFAEATELLGGLASGIMGAIANELIVRPLLYAETLTEVTNWNLTPMPAAARADTLALGLYFSAVIEGDTADELLVAHARSINSYETAPTLVRDVINEINQDRTTTEEAPLSVEEILNHPPTHFFNILYEEGYLDFEHDPQAIVDEILAESHGEPEE